MSNLEKTIPLAEIKQENKFDNNLLNMPVLGALLRNKYFLPSLQVILGAIFIYAIVYGFINPDPKSNIFTNAIFWSLFWPFFMIVTLPFLGKIFCAVCPHGAIGIYLQKYGLNLAVPEKLKNPMIGFSILILAYWAVIYIFPGFLRSPMITALYFIVFTVMAIGVTLVFKKGTYCKTFCPISVPTNVFSRLSFVHLTTYEDKCKACEKSTCVTGTSAAIGCPYGLNPSTFANRGASTNCTYCLKCVSSCSHDSVKISFRAPGSEISKPVNRPNNWEIWGFVILFATLVITMNLHHGIGHTKLGASMPWVQAGTYFQTTFAMPKWIDMTGLFAFITALSVTIGLFVLVNYLCAKVMKWGFSKSVTTYGYAMIPLLAISSLSHALASLFTSYYSNVVNGFSQAFNMGIHVEPLAAFKTPWVRIFEIAPFIGIIWSIVLLYMVTRKIEGDNSKTMLIFSLQVLFVLAFLALTLFKHYAVAISFMGKGH
jgi:ferredoxin